MTDHRSNGSSEWDAIVVGGGHNGLVCAAYLGKAGLRVLVLESREVFGGPSGSFEFMPGYTASFSNSPGSLETRVVEELDLAGAGLRFLRSDPTVIQFFPEHPLSSGGTWTGYAPNSMPSAPARATATADSLPSWRTSPPA